MRKLHRWFGLIAGFFFMIMSLTGIGMETIKLVVPEAPRPAVASSPAPSSNNALPPKAANGSPKKLDFTTC